MKTMNKNSLIIIILSVTSGASAVFMIQIISYYDIINISKNNGINNVIICLISWISVFVIGTIICLYFKKRMRNNTNK
jgi:uncharacterized membrane protein